MTRYAPRVPRDIDPLKAEPFTLIAMVRDALLNGENTARGYVAFELLMETLELPSPQLPLDPEPYAWDDPEDHRSAHHDAHDSAYGYVHFAPRFGFNQEQENYER